MKSGLERPLGIGLRTLLAVIGSAACIAGVIVAVFELREVVRGSPSNRPLRAAFAGLLIALAGGRLVRSALRGRIAFRRVPTRR